jgi:hypothetical protein
VSSSEPLYAKGSRVYVFTASAGRWRQVAELKGAGPRDLGFGGSLALSATTLVVGDADTGRVIATWSQERLF